MVIATVRNFKQEVVYTSAAGSMDNVWAEIQASYPKGNFLMTLSDDEDYIFIDGYRGGRFEAELTPVTFD
jgi:hypothetical protein